MEGNAKSHSAGKVSRSGNRGVVVETKVGGSSMRLV